jgi:hypothetical protein
VIGTETCERDGAPAYFSFDAPSAEHIGSKLDTSSMNSLPSILGQDDALPTIEVDGCDGDRDGNRDADQADPRRGAYLDGASASSKEMLVVEGSIGYSIRQR